MGDFQGSMSLDELKKKNEESREKREREKREEQK